MIKINSKDVTSLSNWICSASAVWKSIVEYNDLF